MYESFNRQALTNRAIAASLATASNHGISVDDPKTLADAYSVRVHLQPAPIVARVSTLTSILRYPIESWLLREIEVSEFLAASCVPVVPPSDLLPSSVHSHDGLFMTFWQYVPRVSDVISDSETVGKMLAELHAVLKEYPGELPLLAPPFNDIPRGIERLQQVGNILSDEDLRVLRETYDTSIGQFKNLSVSLQALHGDAHAYNLIPTAKGLLWNDFEDTCMGSIGWDLVNLDDAGRKAYGDIPDLETLEIYQILRKIHGIVWVFSLSPEFPDWVEYAQTMLNELRDV
jgi:hypothetical protein